MSGGQLHIDTMWAFVALDPADNTEGVISAQMGQMHMPLIGADLERVEMLRPVAQRIARTMHVPVSLVHFTNRVTIEENILNTPEESKP